MYMQVCTYLNQLKPRKNTIKNPYIYIYIYENIFVYELAGEHTQSKISTVAMNTVTISLQSVQVCIYSCGCQSHGSSAVYFPS